MRLVLLAPLLLLAACASTGSTTGTLATDATVNDLVLALESRGYFLQPRGFSTPPLAGATAQEYSVEGGSEVFLQIYEYRTPEQARADASALALNSLRVTPSSVYQRGRLVVATYGTGLNLALSSLLGSPVR